MSKEMMISGRPPKQGGIIDIGAIKSDFFMDVSLGEVAGKNNRGMIGDNPSLTAGVESTIRNVGGNIEYFTTDTAVFISSSNVSDTGLYLAIGHNDKYERIIGLAVANGQTPAQFSSDFFRIQVLVNISASGGNVGDIYIAENTVLTAGVPDDLDKVKVKIPIGDNIASNGTFTTAFDEVGYMIQIQDTTSKANAAKIIIRAREFGTDYFAKTTKAEVFQNSHSFGENIGFGVNPKTDIEFAALSQDTGTAVTAIARIITKKI